ncbi:MAG: UDP-N-acetylmuramate dehydrogenase [bacterium]|nr:UDP-N-acetylmuramate dehydrogenase [bacterium]
MKPGILRKFLPGLRENVLLKDYTTFRIGGPADFFYEAKTEKDFVNAIRISRKLEVPFFILGRGSNTLFDDKGFRGLVIRNMVSEMKISKRLKRSFGKKESGNAHYLPAHPGKYLKFSDLDYPQEPFDIELEVSSGIPVQYLIQKTLEKKLTGLQWFAGIPGSVGGAVVYNIHGGTKLFGDYVKDVTVIDKNNRIRKIKSKDLGFAYDLSNVQKEKQIILRVTLFLSRGDIGRARHVYKEWLKRKLKVQPQTNCPGSIFKNFPRKVSEKTGSPTTGAGWFIDQAGLKGKTIGRVQVSKKHANFIINLGGGKAKDARKLIKTIKEKVKKKFKLNLKEEILILPSEI